MKSTVLNFLLGGLLLVALSGRVVRSQPDKGIFERRRASDIIDIDNQFDGSGLEDEDDDDEFGSGDSLTDEEEEEEEEEDDFIDEEDDVIDEDDDDIFDEDDDIIEDDIVDKKKQNTLSNRNDDEDDDDDDTMGSGTPPPTARPFPPSSTRAPPAASGGATHCLRMREKNARVVGAYRPKCTAEGEYDPVQCHASTGQCWCVDWQGEEISGTMVKAPERPNCTPEPGGAISRSSSPPSRGYSASPAPTSRPAPAAVQTKRPPAVQTTKSNEFEFIDRGSVSPPRGGAGGVSASPPKDRKPDPVGEGSSPDEGVSKVDSRELRSNSWLSSIKDPLALAGAIGGAVLALLCIVLLVMFIIYRMRKKDEGSYALDEPRHSTDIRYTRARQEYFA